jgi:hypothetical protein
MFFKRRMSDSRRIARECLEHLQQLDSIGLPLLQFIEPAFQSGDRRPGETIPAYTVRTFRLQDLAQLVAMIDKILEAGMVLGDVDKHDSKKLKSYFYGWAGLKMLCAKELEAQKCGSTQGISTTA